MPVIAQHACPLGHCEVAPQRVCVGATPPEAELDPHAWALPHAPIPARRTPAWHAVWTSGYVTPSQPQKGGPLLLPQALIDWQ